MQGPRNQLQNAGALENLQITLPRFLFALGIRHVGGATAKDLARHFGVLDAIMDATEEQLLAVNDVGPIVAKAIRTFFEQPQQPRSGRAVACLRRDQFKAWWPSVACRFWRGKTAVLTGTLLT